MFGHNYSVVRTFFLKLSTLMVHKAQNLNIADLHATFGKKLNNKPAKGEGAGGW